MSTPDTKPPIFFIVGRMNPPTPGHVKLIEGMIHSAKKYTDEYGISPHIRVFLSSSCNSKKLNKTVKIDGLSSIKKTVKRNKTATARYTPYVKHKSYENPLTPENKKGYLEKMMKHRGLNIIDDYGNKIVSIRSDCNGIYNVINSCVKPNPLYGRKIFFMGLEIDPKERSSRGKWCKDDIECEYIERTNDKDDIGSSISGSKVRLLASQNKFDEIKKVYNNADTVYLEDDEIKDLIHDINQGLQLRGWLGGRRKNKTKQKKQITQTNNRTNRKRRINKKRNKHKNHKVSTK